jgi:short-subunit dehydrogenase
VSGAVLIVGATSAIGAALARELAPRAARDGGRLLLAGRDAAGLDALVRDLDVRFGAAASAHRFEATALDTHAALLAECVEAAGGPLAGVVVCHGLAPDESEGRDPATVRAVVDVNYASAVSVLGLAADHLDPAGGGFLCGIASVAGVRGRAGNWLYGSAKAGLVAALSGMRQQLHARGVAVITVLPGFTDSPMTWGRTTMFLVASPERVARDIDRAIRRRRSVVYTPWFWRWIMLAIRMIPEWMFRRMKL